MKVAIIGAGGRMGQMLVRQVAKTSGATLVAAADAAGGNVAGRDAGELAGIERLNVPVGSDAAAAIAAAEVAIEFTVPEATAEHAELCGARGVAMVIGTTGLSSEQARRVETAAKRTPIVWSANMSLGVNILLALVERTARLLDPAYDIDILEMHHRHKIDAPSGTALALGRAAAEGREVQLDQVWRKTRDGHTGARPTGEIGFATLRGGDEVGFHTVMFAGTGERLELTHRAFSREIYANGSVKAAQWARGQKPGLYTMKDVLGLAG